MNSFIKSTVRKKHKKTGSKFLNHINHFTYISTMNTSFSIRAFLGLALLAVVSSGCLKSDDNNNNACPYTDSPIVASSAEVTALQNFITNAGLTATAHPSGLFYNITDPGTGSVATVCNRVTVRYSGRLTSGAVFDSNLTGISFTLGQLIVGWQKGIPLIRPGGKITLYVPPSLGYGAAGAPPTIPGNAYLIFDIDLVAVQ
jgi:FKBP-type peptidyl-prolyl cis-trans isomerase FkpA